MFSNFCGLLGIYELYNTFHDHALRWQWKEVTTFYKKIHNQQQKKFIKPWARGQKNSMMKQINDWSLTYVKVWPVLDCGRSNGFKSILKNLIFRSLHIFEYCSAPFLLQQKKFGAVFTPYFPTEHVPTPIVAQPIIHQPI